MLTSFKGIFMSITLYVEDWEKQDFEFRKVYVSEEYPNFTQEDIDFYFSTEDFKKDEKGLYSNKRFFLNPFPELTYSNSNFLALLDGLGYQSTYEGEFPTEQLPEVLQKIIKVINTQKISNASRDGYQKGNFISMPQTEDAAKRKYQDILNLVKFAIENNKAVYWG